MNPTMMRSRLAPGWWTLILIVVLIGSVILCLALFNRSFTSRVPVTLTADRSGLVMEAGSTVKMRGVEVGRVGAVDSKRASAALRLEMIPDQLRYIPANVEAEIKATTAFGNKYVELVYPESPSPQRLSAGQVLRARNVSIEVNTVLESVVNLLNQIDPAKLNATLTALAEGLRGKGETIGEAITAANHVLTAVNPRSETVREDFRSLAAFSDTYADAAPDILATLDAVATTSTTITEHADDLDALLLNVIGLSQAGIDLLAPNKDNLVGAVNILEPTTNLLFKYNPEYTCLLLGAKWFLDNGGYETTGGANGYSLVTDSTILLPNDPYVYPQNLPVVGAKGGPGGKPGCGSLPDPSQNFPVRQLVTNTGWGTGIDVRPNIGLGHPCWANYLPVTRAVPEPPSLRCVGPPSPGLVVPAPGPLPLPPPPAAPAATSPPPP